MAVLLGSINKINEELKDIDKGVTIIYSELSNAQKKANSMARFPIAKIFKDKDNYIVIPRKTFDKSFKSTYEHYYGGIKNKDYKVFKTKKQIVSYINKL
jgi:hypothetical protein